MAIMFHSINLLFLTGLVASANAISSPNASATCEAIQKLYPMGVAYNPLDLLHPTLANLNYTYTRTHYWNGANGQLAPACIFYPRSGQQVADAVKILNRYPDVAWAAKSGGHNPNKGFSSVAGGVLISFRPFMQGTKLSADKLYADVQPGARWGEAVGNLSSSGKAVVGGRLGDVGVGGYTLGGGLSFLSSEYGFACDQVLAYEVVLADGTLTTVSKTQNPDLFYALKGGSNQFAIVTNFRMLTVPIGQVWGGIKVYGKDKASAIINATHDFAQTYPDKKAAVIVTYNTLFLSLTDIFVVFFFYNGPVVPKGVFDKYDAIQPALDMTKVQSYADLLNANDIANIYGFNYLIRAQTIPLLEGDSGRSLLKYQYDSFNDIAAKTQPQNVDFMVYSFAYQPMSTIIQKASQQAGDALGQRNAIGLNPDDGDRMWMEYDISWVNPLDEQRSFRYANQFTDDIVAYINQNYPNAKSTNQKSTSADQLGPSFLNDGMLDQATNKFFSNADYQKLKSIQQARDPKRFFSQRTGGFKFT